MFGWQFGHREDDELKPLKAEFPTLHQGLANILENRLVGCIPNTHAIFNHKTWLRQNCNWQATCARGVYNADTNLEAHVYVF